MRSLTKRVLPFACILVATFSLYFAVALFTLVPGQMNDGRIGTAAVAVCFALGMYVGWYFLIRNDNRRDFETLIQRFLTTTFYCSVLIVLIIAFNGILFR